MEFKTGAIKSPIDTRDFLYRSIKAAVDLPPSHLLPKTKVKDQGKFGCCVGFAASTVKDKQESINHPNMAYEMSPLFIYSECKKRDEIPKIEGTYPRIAMKVIQELGACLENQMPYRLLTDHNKIPSAPADTIAKAAKFKIRAYAQVQGVQEIKQAIYQDGPVLAGVLVAESFLKPEASKYIQLPNGSILGGHAICIDGYDDNMTHAYANGKTLKGFFRIVNSWGSGWGDGGYAWLPYEFVRYRTLDLGMEFFMEAWTSVDIVTLADGMKRIVMWADKAECLVDGIAMTMDQPATISPKTGRTLVPVRFLSEQLGFNVEFEPKAKKITITRG